MKVLTSHNGVFRASHKVRLSHRLPFAGAVRMSLWFVLFARVTDPQRQTKRRSHAVIKNLYL